MRDTGNTDLRKLVHDYYNGELSYASYRQARTQLLDRITAVTDVADCMPSTARDLNKPAVAGQSPGHKNETSRLLRSMLWLLVIALITVMLLVWAMKSESSMLSMERPDPGDTSIFSVAAAGAGIISKEDDRHING